MSKILDHELKHVNPCDVKAIENIIKHLHSELGIPESFIKLYIKDKTANKEIIDRKHLQHEYIKYKETKAILKQMNIDVGKRGLPPIYNDQ